MKEIAVDFIRSHVECPTCHNMCRMHSIGTRRIRTIGVSEPTVMNIRYSKHRCKACEKFFSVDMSSVAMPHGHYSNEVRNIAIQLYNTGVSLEKVSGKMRREHYVDVPITTIHCWL